MASAPFRATLEAKSSTQEAQHVPRTHHRRRRRRARRLGSARLSATSARAPGGSAGRCTWTTSPSESSLTRRFRSFSRLLRPLLREQRPQGSVPAFAPPTPATAGFPRKPFDRGRRAGRQISVVTSGEAARAAVRSGQSPIPNRSTANERRSSASRSQATCSRLRPSTTRPAAPDATAASSPDCTDDAQAQNARPASVLMPQIPRLIRRNQLTTPSTPNTPLRHKRSQILPQHPMSPPITF